MPVKVKWKTVCVAFLVSVVQLATGMFAQRHCNHLYPRPDEVIHGVHIESPHIMRKRSVNQPLRILLYYDESVYRLTEEKFQLINNTILPEAVRFWEQALMVRKTENVIRLNRKCVNNQVFYRKGDPHPYCKNACEDRTMCGEVQVPEDHLEACKTCNASGMDCGTGTSKSGVGIEGADFVFYVSAMETERCHKGLTVAYAAHCQQESSLDRPIAGHANLCPDSISTKPQELEVLLSTVKHEILHALGFSVSLFAFYRDANGYPLTTREDNGKPRLNEKLQARQWSDKVIKTVIRRNWTVHGAVVDKEVQMMVTPRVVEEVRKHFNCSNLEGAELEDQGEDGTALTHWEKRIFEKNLNLSRQYELECLKNNELELNNSQLSDDIKKLNDIQNEAMTGTHTQNPVYSRLTLALMEDTGWYKANYSLAQDLSWGKNLGCDFVTKSCKQWMDMKRAKGQSIHPFCNKVKRDPLETECTDDRSSVALCNLVEHVQPLPTIYQNFDHIPHVTPGREAYYGGSVSLADYCPYIQEFIWRSKSVVIRGSHCQYPENNPHPDKNFALEVYGDNSKCFDHTNQMWEEQTCKQVRQWQHWGSGCYEYSCQNGRLHIIVSNHTYTCYFPGQELVIRLVANGWLHKGVIVCPACEELCGGDGGTSFGGDDEKCKPPSEVPLTVPYHREQLACGGTATVAGSTAAAAITVAVAALLLLIST